MTKTEKVLQHLEQKGSIDSMTAFSQYRVTRLSSIIYNLKKRGYTITSYDKSFTEDNGRNGRYAVYVLKKE